MYRSLDVKQGLKLDVFTLPLYLTDTLENVVMQRCGFSVYNCDVNAQFSKFYTMFIVRTFIYKQNIIKFEKKMSINKFLLKAENVCSKIYSPTVKMFVSL